MPSLAARLKESRPVRAGRGTVAAFSRLALNDHAAALTYYAVLSVFPGMIVLVALLGLLGDEGTVDGLLRIVDDLSPGSAAETFEGAARTAIDKSNAGIALLVGASVAVYSASSYVGAFSRATNVIYEVEETRPFWRTLPLRVGLTVFLLLVLAIALVALLLTGPLVEAVGDEAGIGDTVLTIWSIGKWPALAAVNTILFAVLLYQGPDVDHTSFRKLLPGSVLAMVLWLAASAGFAFYVSNFGSYSNTYGAAAGVIIFLIWLWISNLALLAGASYNVELERAGRSSDGSPSRS